MTYNPHFSHNGYNFIYYQDLSLEHAKQVLSYRNHQDVRKWMFNSNKISEAEHEQFINSLKYTRDKIYSAVFNKEKMIGCIYHDKLEKDIYFAGHFLNPRLISSGIGIYFEYTYLNYFFNHLNAKLIRAVVQKNNRAMVNIHRLCNFAESPSNKKNYYKYELSKEEFDKLPEDINTFISTLINKHRIR